MPAASPTMPSTPLDRCSRSAIHGSLDTYVPVQAPSARKTTATARRSAGTSAASRRQAAGVPASAGPRCAGSGREHPVVHRLADHGPCEPPELGRTFLDQHHLLQDLISGDAALS